VPVESKMKNAKTVLVIEDSWEIRELLCSLLEARGFEVRCCEDGVSALEAAAETTFHVIITDYRMPNMNGIDAAKHLRMRFPASIIIGVSSDDMGKAFLAAGADAFLRKPYRTRDILSLVAVKS
jgi:two-component system response regulator TctD